MASVYFKFLALALDGGSRFLGDYLALTSLDAPHTIE